MRRPPQRLLDYDLAGRMTSRTDAAGTTFYTYDGAGRLGVLTNPSTRVQVAYNYNNLSQVSKITYGGTGNSRHFTFDDLHRPVVDELKKPDGTSIAKITYGWDANDNLVSKTTTGFTGSATNTYTYDLANRLTSWNDGTTTTVYAYDKSGNRVQNGSKLFTYDERNRLLTGDGVSYSYTARGTLATAGAYTTTTDAFGQVITQSSAGGTQTYTYDGLGRVIRPGFAYTGLGNDLAADGTATYTRGPSGELVGEAVGGTQRLAWTDLHTDVVGQFTATGDVLDGSTTYDPLGKVVATSGMIGSLGYQSEWTDSVTGRVNMHARWYNTETGQFDTRDTANNSPVPASINANRYQYGDGNPLTVIDPTGHWGNPFKGLTKKISNAWNKTTSFVSSAWNKTTSYVSEARSWAAEKAYMLKSAAVKKYNQVKTTVKKKVNQVKTAVKKKIDQGRKWGAQKYDQAKKVKQAYTAVKQAGKKVAAIGGAILAGIACTAVTAGAGAVACMVGAGALINLAKDAAQGDIHSIGDALGSLGTGALAGLAGGAGGMIAGRIATAVGSRLGSTVMGRLATEAVENGVGDVIDQVLISGRVDPRAAMMGMVPGLGLLNRKGGGVPSGGGASRGSGAGPAGGSVGGGAGCSISAGRRHSFDPSTPVLMADGTRRPVEDVNVGDQVVATDPETGESMPRPVTQLHRNTDRELTDLTVRDRDGRTTTVETTQNHPFWDATDGRWVEASQLQPGHRLLVHDDKRLEGDGTGAGVGGGGPGVEVTVVEVVNYDGVKEMRDLTVADIHTYYIIAGKTPVLVHNNNDRSCDISDETLDHVLHGNFNAKGRFGGWHLHPEQTGGIPDDRYINGTMGTSPDGTVSVYGKVGARLPDGQLVEKKADAGHTFFPADWTAEDILSAGLHLLANGTQKRKKPLLTATYNGVEITGYLEKKNGIYVISTWFPRGKK